MKKNLDFKNLHEKTLEDLKTNYKELKVISEKDITTKMKNMSWIEYVYFSKDYDFQDSEIFNIL